MYVVLFISDFVVGTNTFFLVPRLISSLFLQDVSNKLFRFVSKCLCFWKHILVKKRLPSNSHSTAGSLSFSKQLVHLSKVFSPFLLVGRKRKEVGGLENDTDCNGSFLAFFLGVPSPRSNVVGVALLQIILLARPNRIRCACISSQGVRCASVLMKMLHDGFKEKGRSDCIFSSSCAIIYFFSMQILKEVTKDISFLGSLNLQLKLPHSFRIDCRRQSRVG